MQIIIANNNSNHWKGAFIIVYWYKLIEYYPVIVEILQYQIRFKYETNIKRQINIIKPIPGYTRIYTKKELFTKSVLSNKSII